jgi:poly(3-hydroxybutyrate) depolymerase
VCPQDYDGYRSADNVNQIINAVIKKYRVDTNRIYLTGLSAGARNIMTYITGSTNYAKRIAAVVPMSIIYMDKTSMSRMKNFATYDVHTKIYIGNQDYSYYKTNVQCRDKINYYKAGLCEFVEYVGAHNGWNKLYNPGRRGMNNVYNWLMQWRN